MDNQANQSNQIWRDLLIISRFNSGINYQVPENIRTVLDVLNKEQYFSTVYGTRYQQRLQDMLTGVNYPKTCILCGKESEQGLPLCSACEGAISKGQKITATAPVSSSPKKESDNAFEEFKSQAKDATSSLNKTVSETSGKVKVAIQKKNFSKKQIAIFAVVAIFLLSSLIGLFTDSSGTSGSIGKGFSQTSFEEFSIFLSNDENIGKSFTFDVEVDYSFPEYAFADYEEGLKIGFSLPSGTSVAPGDKVRVTGTYRGVVNLIEKWGYAFWYFETESIKVYN